MFDQCGGCRVPATLRDPASNKPYTGGYAEPIECLLDFNIGVEYVYADNPRFTLTYHEIMEQGKIVEEARVAVHEGEENSVTRYYKLKVPQGAAVCLLP